MMDTIVNRIDYLQARRQSITGAIIKLRQEAGLSQQDIASLLKCPLSRIETIERGECGYTLEELEYLSLRLGKLPQDLLALEPEMMMHLYRYYTQENTHTALGERLVCELPETGYLPPDMESDFLTPPQIVFSADSSLVAGILGRKGYPELASCVIGIWHRDTGRLLASIELDWLVTALAFSPNKTQLAFTAERDSVWLWDWRKGKQVGVLDAVEDGYSQSFWDRIDAKNMAFGEISHILWTQDNKYIITYNHEHGVLRIWEPDEIGWRHARILSIRTITEAGINFNSMPHQDPNTIQPTRYSIYKMLHLPLENTLFIYPSDDGNIIYQLPLDPESRTQMLVCSAIDRFTILDFDLLPIPAYDEMPFNYLQVIVGNEGYVEYVARQASEYKFTFSTMSRHESYVPADYNHVVIVNPDCILALAAVRDVDVSNGETDWVLTNLVTHQTVALPDLDRDYQWRKPHRNLLTPDGRSVVYLKGENIYIQLVSPEILVPTQFPQPGFQNNLAFYMDFHKQKRAEERSFISNLNIEDLISDPKTTKTVTKPSMENEPVDPVQRTVQRWKTARPTWDGGFGVAPVPMGDTVIFPACLEKIKQRTKETIQVVDARIAGDNISTRQLVSLIVDRPLANGEFTQDITEELKKKPPHTIIFVDHAEHLSADAMEWVCRNQRSVTKTFILVVRDYELFDVNFMSKNKIRTSYIFLNMFIVDLVKEIFDV